MVSIFTYIRHETTKIRQLAHLKKLTHLRLTKQLLVTLSRQDHMSLKHVITPFKQRLWSTN